MTFPTLRTIFAAVYWLSLTVTAQANLNIACPDPGPDLLSVPYIPPWQTLPATPTLKPRSTGYAETDDGVGIWYGLSGKALSPSHQSQSPTSTSNLNFTSNPKPPVLFLHGGFANSDYFTHQIHCLEEHHAIISIDSRGHGRSFDGAGPITYDRMTADVVQVLDHLNVSKVSVVGWSDGGIIALDLVMNPTYAHRVDRVFAFGASYDPANVNISGEATPVAQAYFARVELEYDVMSPTPGHKAVFEGKVNEMWGTLPKWDEHSFETIPRRDVDGDAPLIFIVDGEQEELVNRDVPVTLRDWISFSQLIILPGVSHFAFLQDPVTFTSVLSRALSYH